MAVANTAPAAPISVREAESIIRSQITQSTTEPLPLRACGGRILREAVHADRDFPPYDRVTMDGVAIAYSAFEAGRREFLVEGIQAAGSPRMELASEEHCLEVMTGAMLPRGCDCVIPVEKLSRSEGQIAVDESARVRRLQNIHRQASDHQRGELLLEAGIRLASPEIAVCATVGCSELLVSAPAKAAVVSTGDELVGVEEHPDRHQIRVSNSYAVDAALSRSGLASVELFHSPDDREQLAALLGKLLEGFDLLVVSGGVSAGRFDLVPGTLAELGVERLFHRVAQRPGFPLYFGRARTGTVVFALPGNPISSLVSTHRYIIPFLKQCSGLTEEVVDHALLAEDYDYTQNRTLFLPVRLEGRSESRLVARPVPTSNSGDLAGIARTDGFIELPAETTHFEAGTSWPLYRWV